VSSLSATVSIGDLVVTSFDDLNVDGTKAIFQIQGKNQLDENISNVNWSLTTDDGEIINATELFDLTSNKSVEIVEYKEINNKVKILVVKVKDGGG